jgi:hypothetical protein
VTNEQKLEKAQKLIIEVWEALVPDDPVVDVYYLQIGMTADRLISNLQEMQKFVDAFNKRNLNLA